MPKFSVQFRGKVKGSIGVGQTYCHTIECQSECYILTTVYEKYEHISGLMWRPEVTPWKTADELPEQIWKNPPTTD